MANSAADLSGRLRARHVAAAAAGIVAWFSADRCDAQEQCVLWRAFQTVPRSKHLYYDINLRRVMSVEENLATNTTLTVRQWTGSAWLDLAVPTTFSPRPRDGYALAYDTARRRLVAFGGICHFTGGHEVYQTETLEFNGAVWNMPSITGPVPRLEPAMCYDAGRGRTVLFGGVDAAGAELGDTWEWDGVEWEPVATTGVSARHGAQMAYDALRGRVVLVGGRIGNQTHRDTYEWDGVAWVTGSDTSPLEAARSWLLWDPEVRRVVMWGADSGSAVFDHRWEWTGDSWERTAFDGPPKAGNAVLPVYDPLLEEFVVQNASSVTSVQSGTWSGTEGNWTQRAMGSASIGTAITYDSVRDEFVGVGSGRTWIVERQPWGFASRDAGPRPSGDWSGSRLAFHGVAGKAVGFGGSWSHEGNTQWFDDTVVWNGSSWTSFKGGGPSPRSGSGLVYDSTRGRVLLLSGYYYYGSYNDMWAWGGGTSWGNTFTTLPTGGFTRLAYDSARQRVVLYAAPTYATTNLTTWEYDGSSWALKNSTGPAIRDIASICFDADLGKVVLFGGKPASGGNFDYDQTYTWDGTVWTRLTNLKLTPRTDSGLSTTLVYDSAKGRAMLLPGFYELSRRQDITRQPDPRVVNEGRSAAFQVSAADPEAVTYRWRRNGVPLTDGGRISGAASRVLLVSGAQMVDAGVYDAVVTSSCANSTSARATLTVLCTADVNRDGFVDGADYDSFNNDFESPDPIQQVNADINGDGVVDGIDYDLFINHFEAGC